MAAAIAVVSFGGALLVLKTFPAPWLWLFGLGAIISIVLCVLVRWEPLRNALLAVPFICLPLLAVEAYLQFADDAPATYHFGPNGSASSHNATLGYGPRPNTVIKARKAVGETTVYDVKYHIGSDGLRSSGDVEAAANCVVFFGGSYTFGEGLPNESSLPVQLKQHMPGLKNVVNFAYSGYGPHQMLAALQTGYANERVACNPRQVIYMGLTSHIGRMLGFSPWDTHGPRFVMNDENLIERRGHFDSTTYDRASRAVYKQLFKSEIFNRFLGPRLNGPYRDDELALFAGVISESAKTATEKFPDAQFITYFWDPRLHRGGDEALLNRVVTAMRDAGIETRVLGKDLFPGELLQYQLGKYDRHPNANANRIVAETIARDLQSQWVAAE